MSDPSAEPSIAPRMHRADPLERKRTFWILLAVLAVGVLTMMILQRELGAIDALINAGESESAWQRYLILARSALALMALLGVAAGCVVGHASLAVLRERRYPHSRARLIRDRVIVEGDRAVLVGRLGFLLAAAFIIVSIVGAGFGWAKLATF